MKQILSLVLIFGLITLNAFSQKTGYVDTKYILEKIPEYQAAEKELETLSQQWQKEIDDLYRKVEKMYKDYQAEEVLLTKDVKQQRQDAIMKEEQKAKELQKKRFGYNGDLFKQREEKVKPIQDRVFEAIEAVSKENRLNFVFDKSGSVALLYADPSFDYSDKVLQKLNIGK
ncbi:MAG: OmpH family outer membrane protein [Bacteroidia bacterium]|nr:OmpH family outer membrane protein [Bacteroidia bacterium]